MYFYGYWNHQEQSNFSNVPMALHMPYYMFTTSITEIDIKYPKSTAGGLVVNDNLNFPRTCITFSENTLNVQVPISLFGTTSRIEQSDPAYNFVSRIPSTTITGKWVIKNGTAPKTPAASAIPMSFTVDGVPCYALGNSKTTYTDDTGDGLIASLYFPHNSSGYWQTHDFGYLQLDYSSNQYINSDITGGFTRFTDDDGNVLSSLVGKVIDFGDSAVEIPLYFYEYISTIAAPQSGVRITIKSWDGISTLSTRVIDDTVRKVSFRDPTYARNTRGIGVWTTNMEDGLTSIPIVYEQPTEDRVFLGWSTEPRTSVAKYNEGEIVDVVWDSNTTIYESYLEGEKPSIETITVQLYRNTAEKNRVDKTSYLTTQGTYKGSLRSSCNVLNPEIVIQSNSLPSSNYMFIKEFGNRWYFIEGWRIVATGLYELTASVDVLMTYKEQILNLEAVIERQEYNYNTMLTDDEYLVTEEEETIVNEYENIYLNDPYPPTGEILSNTEFWVLGVL